MRNEQKPTSFYDVFESGAHETIYWLWYGIMGKAENGYANHRKMQQRKEFEMNA